MRPHLVASSANDGTVRLPWVTYRVPWADDAATVVATVARSLAQRNSTYHRPAGVAQRRTMSYVVVPLRVTGGEEDAACDAQWCLADATPCGAHRQLMCGAYRKLEVIRALE
jgi:hypothetical protein